MEVLLRSLPLKLALLAALIAFTMVLLPAPPAQATGDTVWTIAAGGSPSYGHSCVVTDAEQVKCWGGNDYGQLGDGTTTDRSSPVSVLGIGRALPDIAMGAVHTCVSEVGIGVKCWGANNAGQLGDGTITNRATPVTAVGVGTAYVVAGEFHTCAVSGGAVKCWGDNTYGQLGDGTTTDRATPVTVSGLSSGVVRIAAGANHTCAVMASGPPKCWGDNQYGQLGDGTTTSRSVPTDVVGLSGQVVGLTGGIAAGQYHTCVVLESTGVQCWGRNQFGQLGDGTTSSRSVPAGVCADHGCNSPLYDVVIVAAGDTHTCFVTSARGAKCTGRNYAGQLGDGSTMDKDTPFDVVGLTSGVDTVAAGGDHTCASLQSNYAKCWGRNAEGEVGDGTTVNRDQPTDVLGLSPKPVAGDVNCDGHTDSIDAALVLQFSAGLVITLPCFQSGDVDNSSTVNAVDAALILQYVAGLITFVV